MREVYDVAVCGLGPAGRALVHRLLHARCRVLALDPAPERRWTQTLAGWRRQVPNWLPSSAIGVAGVSAVVRVHEERPIQDEYVVLDVPELQRILTIDGAVVEERTVADEQLAGLRSRARVVVDARGARPVGASGEVPHQTAFGWLLPADEVKPILGRVADGVLMDWTHPRGGTAWGRERPSFCYVIPMPDGRVLVEETCLAGSPAIGTDELRRRLELRLKTVGIGAGVTKAAETEHVSIPLVKAGPKPPGVVRFGAAGGQHNPISGYSVMQSFASVDSIVRSVLQGDAARVPDTPGWLRATALRALLRASPRVTIELFDAFSRLATCDQRAVLDADTPTSRMMLAMARQAAAMPAGALLGLVRATLLP